MTGFEIIFLCICCWALGVGVSEYLEDEVIVIRKLGQVEEK